MSSLTFFHKKTYNNNSENVVFLWINQNNGKIFMGVQQNPNRTFSSNTSGTTGKQQKMSKSSKAYKENWVYNAKYTYENNMLNPTKARSLSKEFYEDFHNGDEFLPLIIYFTEEQEGFDFRNELLKILSETKLTYNLKESKSILNPTNKTPRFFYSLSKLNTILKENLHSKKLPNIMENFFNGIFESGMYIDNCETTSISSNEITRAIEMEKIEKEKRKPKYCTRCHIQLSLMGKCLNDCDN